MFFNKQDQIGFESMFLKYVTHFPAFNIVQKERNFETFQNYKTASAT